MGRAKQNGDIVVKCNKCGKEAKVKTIDFYKPGGLRGNCCRITKQVDALSPEGTKTKKEVEMGNTWSTVPAGKLKSQKPSRDRKGRGSMKG